LDKETPVAAACGSVEPDPAMIDVDRICASGFWASAWALTPSTLMIPIMINKYLNAFIIDSLSIFKIQFSI
jgi:hypothetical protein